jgi:ABC-type branched-subunit amino acid transport system ATPase component
LKAIMGLVPAKGEIIFENENIVDKEIFQRARM